jgi:hypothetical protein
MMQLGNAFQGKKCTRCRQVIQSDPAFEDHLWYHRACLEEGKRALQRAQGLTACFGFVSVDSRGGRHPHQGARHPDFCITGRRLVGAQPLQSFVRVI